MKYTNLRINDQVRVTVESGSKCVFKSAVALNFRQFKQKPKDLKYIDVKIKVKCYELFVTTTKMSSNARKITISIVCLDGCTNTSKNKINIFLKKH